MRRVTVLLILALLAVLVSCGRKPGGETPPEVPQFVLPEGEARALEVVFVSPKGEVGDLGDTAAVTAVFNQPMVPLAGVPEMQGQAPARMEPAVPGNWRWRGTATLVFEPAQPLPLATKFTVTVPAGTKSYSGQTLAKDHAWDFVTPRPALVRHVPTGDEEFVRTDTVVFLFFNQVVTPEQATGKVQLLLGKEAVPATVRKLTDEEWKPFQEPQEEPREEEAPASPSPEAGTPERDKVLALAPGQALQVGKDYTVKVAKGLMGQGPLPSEEEETFSFRTVNKFAVESVGTTYGWQPDSSIILTFSNPVSPADLAKHVTFVPEVKLPDYLADRDYHSTEIYLDLPLKARTAYKVRIGADLEDEFGNALGKAKEMAFTTKDFSPVLVMPDGLGVLESKGDLRIPVGFRNVAQAQVQIAALRPDQVVPLLPWGNGDLPAGSVKVDRTWKSGVKDNQFADLPLDLAPALGGRRTGILKIDLSSKSPDFSHSLLLQVTNLGVSAKFSPEDTLVWVTTLHDGKPKPGAEVEIRSEDNRVLFTGKTDPQGLVRAKGWAALGLKKKETWDTPVLYVFARDGEDVAFLSPEGSMGINPWDFDLPVDWSPRARTYAGHAFTERGLYRAGEKVYLKGTLRREVSGRWTIPDDVKSLDYTLTDSRDEKVKSGSVTLSRFGSFDQAVDLAQGAPSGFYSVSYRLPQAVRNELKDDGTLFGTGFRVEAYRPAQFEVTVEAGQPAYVLGDQATAFVRGKYLFGAPMSGEAVKWSARVVPSEFAPEAFEGFRFGPMTFWDEERRDQERVLARQSGRLDGEGQLKVAVELAGVTYQGPGELVVEGTVTSASRQEISGRTSVPVFPASWSAGLKAGGMLQKAGSPVPVMVVACDPKGQAVPGRKVELELIRREWHSVRKAGAGGRYEWVSETEDSTVAKSSATTAGKPVEVPITPPQSGYYVVRATGTDEKGRKTLSEDSFYAFGTGYVAWWRGEGDKIEIVPDKQKYAPGDTARILVKSPYEKATALVTVERELVLDRFVTEVEGSAATVEVPIRSNHLPNVFVSVLLVQGRVAEAGFGPDGMDLGKPSFKIGYANLPVDSGEKRLQVEVKTDRETYEPRGTVNVQVQVRNAQGKPEKAEVCLAVVDEGVLGLIAYQTPGYFDTFYGPRPLSVRTAESRLDVIGQRAYGVKGETSGGGGGLAGEYREDFVTTPFWSPHLVTDDQGVARASFTLPDNLTAFRVMAVVQTLDSDFGSADSRIQVQKPLLLQPSLPRFARLGDRFKAGVLVFNHSGQSGEVLVTADAAGVKLGAVREARVRVEAGQEKEVLFEFEAPEAGDAEVGFKASLGSHADALKMPVPVHRPVPTETTATSGNTAGAGATEGLAVPGGILPGSATLEASVSASALVGLDGAVSDLLGYPYGCLEQRLSRLVPMLLAEPLVRAFALEGVDAAEMRQRVQKGLDEMSSFQRENGGFGLWPDGHLVNDYVTAYAMVTFREALDRDYRVDDAMVTGARGYLKSAVSRTTFDYPYSEAEQLVVRPYGLYALSLHDYRDLSLLNALYGRRKEMPLDGKVYLLRAARRMRADEKLIGTLEDEIVKGARVEAQTAHFEQPDAEGMAWVYASNVRTTALVLSVMLEKGDFSLAPRVVRWLMEAREDGTWGTTQENVACLEALQAYYDRYEKATPDLAVQVKVAGQELLQGTFKGRTLAVKSATTGLEKVPAGTQVDVALERSGKGRLYYDLRLRYAPAKEPPPRDQGFAVFRVVEPVKGGKATAGPFTAGETYRVTLTVLTPSARRFVVVDDPLPAGFEVVQTTFATESDDMREALSRAGHEHPWFASFNHWEIEDSRVLLFADGLEAGEHTFQYLVRAMYPGDYAVPSTKAEEMYHPEVFGTTGSRKVTVK